MKLCDLHTHSTASDGTLSPREVARHAALHGLSAVALTDHNTTLGLGDFLDEGKRVGIDTVAGVEVSVDFLGYELHILGLFLPDAAQDAVEKRVRAVVERKEKSNEDLARRLTEAGYPITLAELKARYKGYINRSHFSRVLKEKGLVCPEENLFDTLLSEERGLYVPPEREDAAEMVAFLRRMGAVPVWAHPFLKTPEETVLRFLPLAKEAGLRGLEVEHYEHDGEKRRLAMDLCRKFDLLPSGGSDFHGSAKAGVEIGVGKGDLRVPYAWYEALRDASVR